MTADDAAQELERVRWLIAWNQDRLRGLCAREAELLIRQAEVVNVEKAPAPVNGQGRKVSDTVLERRQRALQIMAAGPVAWAVVSRRLELPPTMMNAVLYCSWFERIRGVGWQISEEGRSELERMGHE